jgi:hypothetical protein
MRRNCTTQLSILLGGLLTMGAHAQAVNNGQQLLLEGLRSTNGYGNFTAAAYAQTEVCIWCSISMTA